MLGGRRLARPFRSLEGKGGQCGEELVELIVDDPSLLANDRVLAIETKLARTVTDRDITGGRDAYRRPDGIGVVPAALLGP